METYNHNGVDLEVLNSEILATSGNFTLVRMWVKGFHNLLNSCHIQGLTGPETQFECVLERRPHDRTIATTTAN